MAQVFISYSRKDLTFVEQLALDLKGAGLEVWYDVSRLEGGERWRTEIQNAIKSSQYVIIVLSPDSVESVWVEREFIYSSNLNRKIIPLLYRQCELPLNYLDLNFVDVQGENYQRNFDRVLKALSVTAVKLIPADTTHVKKPLDDKKTLIWAGIIVTFSSVLLSLAINFLLGKANIGQAVASAPPSLSEIDQKYLSLGGAESPLGEAVESEQGTPDGNGLFREYQNGLIYSHPDIGTVVMYRDILDKWNELGRESSPLGYPTSNDSVSSDEAGHFNEFQGGAIYSHPDIGTVVMYRDIFDKWNELGRETSCLGYPVSDQEESGEEGVFQSRFEHGIIKWSAEQGAVETCD